MRSFGLRMAWKGKLAKILEHSQYKTTITFENIKDEIENLKIIGEGWRAKVYRGKYQNKDLSFKVASQEIHKHPYKRRTNFKNSQSVWYIGEDFIVYEYIEESHLNKVLNEENFKILNSYREVLQELIFLALKPLL
jgi:predicted Ser/Thr protein kinase